MGERGGSVVECRTPEREVRGSRPTAAVLCPWARHFTPRKYWLITQEAMAPSRYDWKIVDWDVKPQHNFQTIFYVWWHLNIIIFPPTPLLAGFVGDRSYRGLWICCQESFRNITRYIFWLYDGKMVSPVWSESSLSAWRKRTAKALIRLGECPDWSESSLGYSHFIGFVMRWLKCAWEATQ